MKKKIIIFIYLICFLLGINVVEAKSTFTCITEVAPDEYIECKINIDNEPVIIESDGNIDIYNLSGNKYSKLNSNKALFYESGTIKFGPANDKYSKYIISLYDEDGLQKYDNDIRVSVIRKTTTTTVTTTTTTTTKKKSTNNYLSDIKINNESINNFDKNNNKYYITYPYEIEKVIFEATREDENASIELNGPNKLEVGDNEFTIGVTSEDNTTRYYKILITRNEKNKELSSDTKLSNINVDGYKFNFNKNSKTYHLKIKKDEQKLALNVETNDKNAVYNVVNNDKLIDGSEIKIIVTAEDGTTDTYRIIITKETNKNMFPIIAIVGLIVILTIIVIVIIILSKKNKNNTKEKTNIIDSKENSNIVHDNTIDNSHSGNTIKFNAFNSETKIIEQEKTVVFTNNEKSED